MLADHDHSYLLGVVAARRGRVGHLRVVGGVDARHVAEGGVVGRGRVLGGVELAVPALVVLWRSIQ